jgi:hypothetical protein
VPPRQLDDGVPVRANAELLRGHAPAPFAGDKDDRDPLEAARTPLEQALRRVRFHAADVDGRRSARPAAIRCGEPAKYEPERGASDCQHEKREHAALDAHSASKLSACAGNARKRPVSPRPRRAQSSVVPGRFRPVLAKGVACDADQTEVAPTWRRDRSTRVRDESRLLR